MVSKKDEFLENFQKNHPFLKPQASLRCLIVVMPVIPPPLLMEIAFTIFLDGSSREERCVSIFFTPKKNLQATKDKGNKKQMDIVVR